MSTLFDDVPPAGLGSPAARAAPPPGPRDPTSERAGRTAEPGAARPSADQLLEGLNPQQREAVLHEGSPLLIV
ncbi:MAG: hypothetical protein H7231_11615, partial [Rhodoferax sp.]|nr:hypothetical protein [Actinomycetota bacterium]